MTVYTFKLACRACGHSLDKRLTQFDTLPTCTKCGSEMLVGAVLPEPKIGGDNERKRAL